MYGCTVVLYMVCRAASQALVAKLTISNRSTAAPDPVNDMVGRWLVQDEQAAARTMISMAMLVVLTSSDTLTHSCAWPAAFPIVGSCSPYSVNPAESS